MTRTMTTPDGRALDFAARAELAKAALERVCSGADVEAAARYYSEDFVDHVNDLEFQGLAGARRSVEIYTRVLSEIEITVQDQMVDVDRVTSRFLVTASCRGRAVRFGGITISRFEDGLIVEDWSVTDTLGLLRQVGPWRSIVLAFRAMLTRRRGG